VVRGEPGIGKTALLTAGLDRVEAAGCQLFIARADETSPVFPLRVLLDALRVGPDAADPDRAEIAERLWGRRGSGPITAGDPVAAAAEMLLILLDRLCTASPVVLAVDDLQWADEMSLAVWGRLGRSVAQLPLLLVAAARPVPRREHVDRLRRSLAGSDPVELPLRPLDQGQVATLVRRLVSVPPGRDLRRLVGQAGGNPLYVRELVDALTLEHRIEIRDDMAELVDAAMVPPSSLAAAIGTRLTFLSETTARVLRTAALLGVEFRVEYLSILTGQAATALSEVVEEALAAGVLTESGTALAFRHGLIHRALYEAMPGALRVALHQQAAQTLAAASAPVETVAEQLLASPQSIDGWAVEWLVGAAPTLITRAPQVAVDLLTRARHTHAVDPHRTLLDVRLIDAQSQLGRYHEVVTLARPLLSSVRDPELVGRVTWALAYAHRSLGASMEVLGITSQALAEQVASARWSARLRALQALALCSTLRYDEARTIAEQAAADGERAGDRIAVGWALFASAQVQAVSRPDQAAGLTLVERAAAVLGDDPDASDLRLLLLGNRASALWNMGRRSEATQALGQALAAAERAGTRARLATLRVQTAEIAFIAGRWDDALPELEAAGDLPPHNPTRVMLRGLAALIAVHRDDETAMKAHLRTSDEEIPSGSMHLADNLLVAGALAAERDRQPERALTALLDVLDPGSTRLFSRLSPDKCLWLTYAVRLALAVGDRSVAEAAAEACTAEAQRQPAPATQAAADHCRGLVEADHALVLSAANAFQRAGYPLFAAEASENAAVLLAQRGDGASARLASAEALRIYQDLDATWDIRRTDARLRAVGIRRGVRGRRRRPTTGWESLTPTEAKVAELVTAGKSNPDIAAELYLSRGTVQTHVSHILTKLDCRSRIDIVRHAMTRVNAS